METYVGLLRQKLEETERELMGDSAGYAKTAEQCEAAYQSYSALAKDCIAIKRAESEAFEQYISACQEKEKAQVNMRMEVSDQRMKIKLLQETLRKQNEEFEAVQQQNRHIVAYII